MMTRLARNGRRVRQTLTEFDNGTSLLTDLVRHRLTGRPDELVFGVAPDLRITCPNVPGARVPVYEIFAEDAYRLAWFTQGLSAPVLVDIGGHIGCFSTSFARLIPDARVNTYEASPTTYEFLRRNVEDNGLGERIRVNHLAVSDHEGGLEFADNGAGSGLNGLTAPSGSTVVTVPCITFAGAVERAGGHADVVKIDTEGAEYDIVLASDPAAWSGVSRVVLEYHEVAGHTREELFSFFEQAGLSVVHHEPITDALGTAWLSRTPLGSPTAG